MCPWSLTNPCLDHVHRVNTILRVASQWWQFPVGIGGLHCNANAKKQQGEKDDRMHGSLCPASTKTWRLKSIR